MGRLRCLAGATVAGSRPSRSGGSRRRDELAPRGLGRRPCRLLLPPLGAARRVRKAGDSLHFTPGSHAREEEPILTPGKGRGGAGGLISFLPVVGCFPRTRVRLIFGFSPRAPTLSFPATSVLLSRIREEGGGEGSSGSPKLPSLKPEMVSPFLERGLSSLKLLSPPVEQATSSFWGPGGLNPLALSSFNAASKPRTHARAGNSWKIR